MEFKKFWKESFLGLALKNIILAIIIFVALVWGTLIGIDHYTHHGESEIVPDLRGLYIEEAQMMLNNHALFPQVIDSVYIRDKKLGTIIEQIPAAGSSVKQNRPIYLIINSRLQKKIPLPDVNDVSYRQADAMLKAIGLNVGSVEYAPSEYKDLVIDVKYNGKTVSPGTRIPEGSLLVLVVGSGLGGELTDVPQLLGLNLNQAKESALTGSLILGAVEYDILPSGNEDDYVIYSQHPASGESASVGTRIDIWLTRDKSLLDKSLEEEKNKEKTSGDEEFF